MIAIRSRSVSGENMNFIRPVIGDAYLGSEVHDHTRRIYSTVNMISEAVLKMARCRPYLSVREVTVPSMTATTLNMMSAVMNSVKSCSA